MVSDIFLCARYQLTYTKMLFQYTYFIIDIYTLNTVIDVYIFIVLWYYMFNWDVSTLATTKITDVDAVHSSYNEVLEGNLPNVSTGQVGQWFITILGCSDIFLYVQKMIHTHDMSMYLLGVFLIQYVYIYIYILLGGS